MKFLDSAARIFVTEGVEVLFLLSLLKSLFVVLYSVNFSQMRCFFDTKTVTNNYGMSERTELETNALSDMTRRKILGPGGVELFRVPTVCFYAIFVLNTDMVTN